jgi:hypothetical protein
MGSTVPESDTIGPRKRVYLFLAIAIAVIVVAVSIGGYYYYLSFAPGHRGGPGNLGYTGVMRRASPGSAGCGSRNAEVCYSNGILVTYGGSVLSDLSFEVTEQTNADAQAPSIPLGPNATVTLLNSTNAVAGVWDWSQNIWVSGSEWVISPGQAVDLVLDTGLLTNSTLAEGIFWVTLSPPNGGSIGAPLGY